MLKAIVTTIATVILCVAVSSTWADAPATSTLNDMGLSSLQVMTDAQALEIRGLGFQGMNGYNTHKNDHGKKNKTHKSVPSVEAWGKSKAHVGSKWDGGAESENGYKAAGKYAAGGENFSEASKTIVETELVNIDGSIKSVTTTKSIHVKAGGFSSGMAL